MFDLIPWERTKSLSKLRKEMDDLWGRFFGDVGFQPFAETIWGPALDVKETKDNIVITAELPGMSSKDIEVSISGDLLTLKGEKKQEKEERGGILSLGGTTVWVFFPQYPFARRSGPPKDQGQP